MTKNLSQSLKNALTKKAIGYTTKESVDEFVADPDTQEMRIVRRKITKKHVPPDLSAAKLLFEITGDKTFDLSSLSDKELEKERQLLTQILEENNA